jgi:hypothetical protein
MQAPVGRYGLILRDGKSARTRIDTKTQFAETAVARMLRARVISGPPTDCLDARSASSYWKMQAEWPLLNRSEFDLRAHPIRRFGVNRAATVFTRLPHVPKIMPDVPPSTPVPLFDGQASGLVERMVERPEHND